MQEFNIPQSLEIEVSQLRKTINSLLWITKLFRTVGYSILVLVFIDLIDIFVPLNFKNPVWEFQMIGALVDLVAITLIGLALVFSGKLEKRLKWEFPFLLWLSRLCLLVGLLYLLLIPLGINNTISLYNVNIQGLNQDYSQQELLNSNWKQQSDLASAAEFNNLREHQSMREVKTQTLVDVNQSQNHPDKKLPATNLSRNFKLLKSSVKFNLGALLAAALFITIWKETSWAR
ncbi:MULTISPECIES: HpsJ-like protein, cyanoexosortase A-associated [unclassified Tolypothrix]|uniref:HpsJ-like protein, cyanoexosortase A-associated n=1 Tax=unclassified Tolypothrix TaxID=2649714 RepID=UPI0005EAB20A|nr:MULTISPECIES: HpsJ family protein [unclassified Tolypothrix]BAY93419.1 hypothetical protein NIES3275_54580 [Microchaete diplosiphon NIES-3275]EKE99356.1 hypothetical protein FDUTEX481_10117 [Tolypothrix sp. PCC 7601]MBE9082873.1 hypothetical protein [Tolypothrix sp. LEGE 11397]UYD27268.1 hypothetical protein HGR01_03960 [Tolypothrix sp. PCC 7712]UYD36873.1 hypothetical protein HG267_14780 [Tolypothrix sp. PCC 7601]